MVSRNLISFYLSGTCQLQSVVLTRDSSIARLCCCVGHRPCLVGSPQWCPNVNVIEDSMLNTLLVAIFITFATMQQMCWPWWWLVSANLNTVDEDNPRVCRYLKSLLCRWAHCGRTKDIHGDTVNLSNRMARMSDVSNSCKVTVITYCSSYFSTLNCVSENTFFTRAAKD